MPFVFWAPHFIKFFKNMKNHNAILRLKVAGMSINKIKESVRRRIEKIKYKIQEINFFK